LFNFFNRRWDEKELFLSNNRKFEKEFYLVCENFSTKFSRFIKRNFPFVRPGLKISIKKKFLKRKVEQAEISREKDL